MRSFMIGVAIAASALAAPAAQAREGNLNPFVKDPYYLGGGGTQVTLPQFASDPARYLRPGAYVPLRQHIANRLRLASMNDAELKSFLSSDKARAVPCEGRLYTAGFRPNGTIGWINRDCRPGELIVQGKNTSGEWVDLFSLACGNPADMLNERVVTRTVTIEAPPPEQLQSYASPAQGHQMVPFNPVLSVPIIINSNPGNGECCDDGCS